MQIREGSSKYPSDLIEKFSIQEEAALKFIPAEDKTLVVNFENCWNKPAEMKNSKRFAPFKNSLDEQFRLISYDITESRELITFLWTSLYRLKKKTQRTVYFCHPSFIKKIPEEGSLADINLENVALRIPLERNDLVLMGNIVTSKQGKINRREYVVKGLSLLNKSSHFGEIRVDTALIVRVMNSTMKGFYTPKGELAEGMPANVYEKSVITQELIAGLNRRYIVNRPAEVLAKLSLWEEFLNSEKNRSQEHEAQMYSIERPELFLAYRVDAGKEAGSKNILVHTPDATWIEAMGGEGDIRLVARLTHKANYRLLENDGKYLERYDSLVYSGIKVIDPIQLVSSRSDRDKGAKDLEKKLSRIGDEYLAPSTVSGMQPAELTDPLKKERDDALSEIRNEHKKRIASEIEAYTAQYLASDEVQSILGELSSQEPDQAQKEGPEDLRKSELKKLETQYRRELRSELERKYSSEKKARIKAVVDDYNAKMASLYEGSETCTITTYFEIPVPRSESVIDTMRERNKFFGKFTQFSVVSDQLGSIVNIDRQGDALKSFMHGEVANPYLASYLFNTETARIGAAPRIDNLFGSGFNDEQKRAVEEAVGSDGLYLIRGPPGTGKTQVIAEITIQEVIRGKKVLIASQNNKAIDNAFDRLFRNAVIRPVRLMSENKTSDTDLDHVVKTFYRNLSGSLKDQLALYDDDCIRNTIREKFSEIRTLFEKYTECKEDAEEPIEELWYDEADLSALTQKLDDMDREENEKDSMVELENRLIDGLDSYEMASYSDHLDEIKDLFRPFMKVTARNERAAEMEIESRLFGKFGYCYRLMGLSDEVFSDQMDLMEDNRGYVDLVRRLYTASSEEDRSEISLHMDKYLQDANVSADDFVLLDIFRADLPSNLPDIRDHLSRIREKEEFVHRSRLEGYQNYERDPARKDELVRKIDDIREEMEDYRQDKDYQAYLSVESDLSEKIQGLVSLLDTPVRFKDLEEAYHILEHRTEMICAMNDDDLALSKDTLNDIISYLDKECIDTIDRKQLTKELRNYINVVGITCTAEGQGVDSLGKGDEKIYLDATTMGIDVVIIDEVSKVPFPELLRPIISGKSVILVGDDKQLPPIYNARKTKNPEEARRENEYKTMYETPLFEELFEKTPDNAKIMLRKQYRMSSQIMNVINRFYGSGLEQGCSDESKKHNITIPGILENGSSVLFVNCKGTGIRQEGSTSFENTLEAKAVSRLIQKLEEHCEYGKNGKPLEECQDSDRLSLGVISPYAAHNRLIKRMTNRYYETIRKSGRRSAFRTDGEEKFAVKSVDDFQGDERDIIILSLVRDSKSSFVSDVRRINVAMSRARRLLIIVGDGDSLMNGDKTVYKEIISDIKEAGGFIESSDVLEVE